MTSHNESRHHKIFGSGQVHSNSTLRVDRASPQANERGYTLVALMAVMTLMTLFALAAAPNILQQAQREREKEAIFRGEEVADAIRLYYAAQKQNKGTAGDPALPTSIDDLLEGVPRSGHAQRSCKCCAHQPRAIHFPRVASGNWSGLVRRAWPTFKRA